MPATNSCIKTMNTTTATTTTTLNFFFSIQTNIDESIIQCVQSSAFAQKLT